MEIRFLNITDPADCIVAMAVVQDYIKGYLKFRKPGRDMILGERFLIKHTDAGNIIIKHKYTK